MSPRSRRKTKRTRIAPGEAITQRELQTVAGDEISLPEDGRLVHLQLRRYAGCPICNLHLRSIALRHAEIEHAGIREIVVFHSPASELEPYAEDVPFALVADPDRALYLEFGVERSLRSLTDPRVWSPAIAGALRAMHARRLTLHASGGYLGLPGDFLIAPDGRIVAYKYGDYAYDQWSVDDLLALATEHQTPRSGASTP